MKNFFFPLDILIIALLVSILVVPFLTSAYIARERTKDAIRLMNKRYDTTEDIVNIKPDIIVKDFDFTGHWFWFEYSSVYRIEIRPFKTNPKIFWVTQYSNDKLLLRRKGKIENGIMKIKEPLGIPDMYFTRLIPVEYRGKNCLLPSTNYDFYIEYLEEKNTCEIDRLLFYNKPPSKENISNNHPLTHE
jgi:hypothetical protein